MQVYLNNMPIPNEIQTIVQGGAVGLAVMLITLIGFMFKKIINFMANHVNENTKSNQKLTDSNERLADMITELYKYLKMKNGN